jgi:hypothetical protein
MDDGPGSSDTKQWNEIAAILSSRSFVINARPFFLEFVGSLGIVLQLQRVFLTFGSSDQFKYRSASSCMKDVCL